MSVNDISVYLLFDKLMKKKQISNTIETIIITTFVVLGTTQRDV
jgi:hypothetical protein